jgi:hypothetical protein
MLRIEVALKTYPHLSLTYWTQRLAEIHSRFRGTLMPLKRHGAYVETYCSVELLLDLL